MKTELALKFIQNFDTKPVYTTKEAISLVGSKNKTYGFLKLLKSLNLIKLKNGSFIVNNILASQSSKIIEKILPSLNSLSMARRFGKRYNELDVKFTMKNIKGIITLDYKAYELTKFQTPRDLYIYVQDVNKIASLLKENRFREGHNGRVVILPMLGEFDNEIQRVYFDCLANSGRSIQDAVAIELLYHNKLSMKANFPIELVQKVEDDLPINNIDRK